MNRKLMRIELQWVKYMPKDLKAGVLYASREYGIAIHLCPCGCGAKVRTPLGPTEWSLKETRRGPTLYPSVGNWQQPCQSHYWIWRGEIQWAGKWTPEQIAAGRRREEERRRAYYESLNRGHGGILRRLWQRVKGRFS